MEEIVSVMGSLFRILVILGGGFSTMSVAFAGFSFMTANGDPHKLSQAKMGVAGAIGGMVLVGIAFIVPGVISRTVIEPAGGTALITEQGLNCDDVLKQQLVFQRGASTAQRMNILVNQIQSQRASECNADLWNPSVVDAVTGGGANDASAQPIGHAASCMGMAVADWNADTVTVGASRIPSSLRVGTGATNGLRTTSGRDSSNNIIVYFSDADRRPSDSAKCWMYSANLRTWDQNYG